jgi:CubicO group peptidase (beta-lactamase class C family)
MTLSATLPTSTPEAQGIGSEAILAFLDAVEAADGLDLHSLMLLRHGAVVAEGYWAPYDAETPHMLFSLSKSFTSTAIGLLVAEGKLTIEDEVLPFFPNKAPAAPDANLRALRVKHLLTMTTGHDVDPTRAVRGSSEWIRGFFAEPLLHEPGTHFVYNSLATYLLSAIAQRLAGQRILEYLRPRLFEPLGIENPTWEQSPEGIDVGGWGLSIRTRDIARFGQLYLQRGTWEGRQLVPLAWVDEATGRRVPNSSPNPDWEQGYGYQFWRCRYGAYRGDGAFGQFCVVLPAQDAVLAITSGVTSMQAVLDLVWTHLLPAFGPAPLAQDGGARWAEARATGGQRELADRRARLGTAVPDRAER